MATRRPQRNHRRVPKQKRARQTFDAVLDAVSRVLKRRGAGSLTTNRIAEAAGVSIGSLYQYFPEKGAILLALRERHVEQMCRLVDDKLLEHAAAPLEILLREIFGAMVAAHAIDPPLYNHLLTQLPHSIDDRHSVDGRLCAALRLALSSNAHELSPDLDIDRTLFVLGHLIESLAHAVALGRPPALPQAAATEEALRAILGYLRWQPTESLQSQGRPNHDRSHEHDRIPARTAESQRVRRGNRTPRTRA